MTSLVLLLLTSEPSLADQLEARLSKAAVQEGTFEQSKQVKGFKRPIRSNGTYRVTRGQGVQWNTLAPFPSELQVSASEISSKQNGKEVFKLDAKAEPTVRIITQLLFSVLSGELRELEAHFTATGTIGPREWSVELVPLRDALKKVFVLISIKGDASVRSVHLLEASGDATLIQLTPAPVDGGAH